MGQLKKHNGLFREENGDHWEFCLELLVIYFAFSCLEDLCLWGREKRCLISTGLRCWWSTLRFEKGKRTKKERPFLEYTSSFYRVCCHPIQSHPCMQASQHAYINTLAVGPLKGKQQVTFSARRASLLLHLEWNIIGVACAQNHENYK